MIPPPFTEQDAANNPLFHYKYFSQTNLFSPVSLIERPKRAKAFETITMAVVDIDKSTVPELRYPLTAGK